jgi:hypothetical protein
MRKRRSAQRWDPLTRTEDVWGPAVETGWGRPRDLGRRDYPWPKQAEVGQAGEKADQLGADGHITYRDAGT